MDSDTEEELWSWYKTVKKKDLRPQRCGWLQQLREEAKQKKKENSPFKENENEKYESNFGKVEIINNTTPRNHQTNAMRTPLREQMPSPGIGISPISNTMLTPTMILPRGTDVSSPHNISILSSPENAFIYSPEDKQPGNTTMDIAASLGAALDDPSTQWTPGLATPGLPANNTTVTPTSDRSTKGTPSSVTSVTNTTRSVSAMYTTPVARNDRNNSPANSHLRQKVLVRSLFSPNLNESKNSSSPGIKKLMELEESSEKDMLPSIFTSSAENLKKEIEEASKSFEEFGKYSQVFSLGGENNVHKNNVDDVVHKLEEIKPSSESGKNENNDRIVKGANFKISDGTEKDDVSGSIEQREYIPSSPSKKKRKLNTIESTQNEFQHSFSGIDSTNNNIAARIGYIDSTKNHHSPPNPPLPKPHHTPLFKSKIAEKISEEYSPKHSNNDKPSKQNNSVSKILSKLSRQKNKKQTGRFLYPINKGGGYEELNIKYKDNLCDENKDLENKVNVKLENANDALADNPDPPVSPQINRNQLSNIQQSFLPLSKLEGSEKLKKNLIKQEISPEPSTSTVITDGPTVISSKQTVSGEDLANDLKSHKEKGDNKKLLNSRNYVSDEFDAKIKDDSNFVVPDLKYNDTKSGSAGRTTTKSMKKGNLEPKRNIPNSQQYHMNDTFNDALFADMDLSFCLSGRATGTSVSDQEKGTKVMANKGFGGFTTGSGSKVAVSESALQRAREVLEDVDQDENGSKEMLNETTVIENKGFGGFTTGSGSKVTVSENALQRARKVLEEVDQDENRSKATGTSVSDQEKGTMAMVNKGFGGFTTGSGSKVALSERALQQARKSIEDVDQDENGSKEMLTDNQPSSSKCMDLQGFKTGSGGKVTISEAAVQRSRKMFEEAEQKENISDQMSKIDYGFSKTSDSLTGFMTGTGKKVIMSDAALKRSRKMFEEAEQKENLNDQMSEIDEVLWKPSDSLTGFMTGTGKKVTMSEDALKHSRKMFEEAEQKEKEDLNEQLPKIYESNSNKCAGFTGFMTGSGNKVTMSDAALQRSRKMFEEAEQKENASKHLSKIDDGFSKESESLIGFMTGTGNKVIMSEAALQRSRKIFEEVEQKDNESEEFSKTIDNLSSKSAAFAGFKTGSGNKVTISENALQRSKTMFKEADQKDGNEKSSKNIDSVSNKPAAFSGFTTGSGNKVSISEKALLSARKVLEDVEEGNRNKVLMLDIVPESITPTYCAGSRTRSGNKDNLVDIAPKTFEEAKQINNESGILSINNASLPNKHIGFPGFMTGHGNKVKVSDKAILHARKVLEEIDKENNENKESTNNNETVSNNSAGFSGNVNKSILLKVQKSFEPKCQNNASKEPPKSLSKKNWDDDSTDAVVPDLNKNKDADFSEVLKGSSYNSNENLDNSTGSCNSKKAFKSVAHGFKTASGNNVKVNEASLNKAKMLWNEECEQDKDLKVGAENFKENSPMHIKTQPSVKLQTPVGTTTQFDSFQTAAGRKLHVNPAAYQKGKKLMEEISQDQKIPNQELLEENDIIKQDKHIKENFSKVIDIENQLKNKSDHNRDVETFDKSNFDLGGFKTAAGLGIKVNKSALAKASKIWNDIEDKNINNFNIEPGANNSNLEQNIEKVSNVIGFQTGKGETIQVSENANEKAKKLLIEPGVKLSNSQSPLGKLHDKYKDILSDKTSENSEQINFINTVKDLNRNNGTKLTSKELVLPGIGFTTASGSKLKLSTMAIEKAKKLMEDVQDLDKYSESFKDANFVSDDILSKIDTSKKSLKSNYEGFSTGNGKQCKVSNDSLKKAQNLLADSNNTNHELIDNFKSKDSDDEVDFIGFDDNLKNVLPQMKGGVEKDPKLQKVEELKIEINNEAGLKLNNICNFNDNENNLQSENTIDGEAEEEEPRTPSPVLGTQKFADWSTSPILGSQKIGSIKKEKSCKRSLIGNISQISVNSDTVSNRTEYQKTKSHADSADSPVYNISQRAIKRAKVVKTRKRLSLSRTDQKNRNGKIEDANKSPINKIENGSGNKKEFCVEDTDLVDNCVVNAEEKVNNNQALPIVSKIVDNGWSNLDDWKHETIINNSSFKENKDITIEEHSNKVEDYEKGKCVNKKEDQCQKCEDSVNCVKQGKLKGQIETQEISDITEDFESCVNEGKQEGQTETQDISDITEAFMSCVKEGKRESQTETQDISDITEAFVSCVKEGKQKGQTETQDISDITEAFLFDESSSEPWDNETSSQGRKRSRGESEELSGNSKRSRNETDQDISILSQGNTSIVTDKHPKDIREEILEERSMLKLKQSKTAKYKERRSIAPIQGDLSKLRSEDKKSRIKLSTLGPLKRIKNCSSYVYSMTPEKAEKFRFPVKSEETSSLTCGDGCVLVPGEDECVGAEEVECGFFAMAGVQPKLVPAGWVMNHYKWIIWSLSGTERRLGHKLGRILNINNVLLRLKYRYDREIDKAERPVLRKITEQDDISQKSMILCVSNIITMKKSPNKPIDTNSKNMDTPPGVIVRLTDGWYSVCSSVDSSMCQLISDGIVRPGTKLYIHGAELGGVTSACHPLDAPPTLRLKLHTNMVRRARWWSRLGVAAPRGPLPSALAAIRADGGTIGRITVAIARMYPMQYMEKSTTGGRTLFRGEKAHNKHLNQKMQQSELEVHKIVEEVQKDFEKSHKNSQAAQRGRLSRAEISKLNSGQELAKLLEEAIDPSSLQDLLTSDQMEIARRWQQQSGEQKQRKIHAEVQKRISAKGKPYSFTPLCKLRVVDSAEDVAIVTMWRPNEELLQGLSEGMAVNISYLQSNGIRQGTMQLTASKTTHWEPLLGSATPQNLPDVTRTSTALCQLSPSYNKADFGEIDLVGVVFRVDLSGQIVYLVDHCGNIITLKVWGGVKECGYEEMTKDGTILCIMNGSWRGHTGGRFCQVHVTELTVLSCAPRQEHLQEAQQHLKESIKDMHTTLLDANKFLDNNVHQRTMFQNKNEMPQKQNNASTSLVASEDRVDIQGACSANLSDAIASPSSDSVSKLRARQAEVRNKMQNLQHFSSPAAAAMPTLHSPISARLNKPFRAPLRNKGKNIT